MAFLNLYRGYFALPNFRNYNVFCKKFSKNGSKALDLGCGITPKNPFFATELFGVDVDYGIDHTKNILPCDLGMQKLPFPDNSFDFVTAYDLIEHIPRITYKDNERRSPFLFLMSEIYRVLKDDGIFLSHTPAYPRIAAFSDPTHVNIITTMTFKLYFCLPYNWATRYGFIGSFQMLAEGWDEENLVSIMQKNKNNLSGD
ncbi:MAG: class I SAM-dependent methyltransferase [Betaproteobacteria bacterium]|nr:class I SAM-dependent methyltransferase [Betaproteobacteria bacterium]